MTTGRDLIIEYDVYVTVKRLFTVCTVRKKSPMAQTRVMTMRETLSDKLMQKGARKMT
jgi:hypothetical protein